MGHSGVGTHGKMQSSPTEDARDWTNKSFVWSETRMKLARPGLQQERKKHTQFTGRNRCFWIVKTKSRKRLLKDINNANESSFWKMTKRLTAMKQASPAIMVNNRTITDPLKKANAAGEFYTELFENANTTNNYTHIEVIESTTTIHRAILTETLTATWGTSPATSGSCRGGKAQGQMEFLTRYCVNFESSFYTDCLNSSRQPSKLAGTMQWSYRFRKPARILDSSTTRDPLACSMAQAIRGQL